MDRTHRRSKRLAAVVITSALALCSTPLSGTAGAADPLPPLADPVAPGAFCEDVPRNNPFGDLGEESPTTRDVILCLVGTGLTKGTTPTTYSPGAPVTRRQMALFVKRLGDLANELEETPLADLPPYDQVPDYPDVVLEQPEFREAIGQLTQATIVKGFSDGTFRPAALVSRRQMAAFVNRLHRHLTGAAFTTSNDYFDDDEGDTGEADLNALASVGIYQGDGAGQVDPGGRLTRRQMANILLRYAQVLFADGDVRRPDGSSAPPPEPGNAAPVSFVARMTTAAGDPDAFDAGDVVQIAFSEALAPPAPAASIALYDTAPVVGEADITNGVNATFSLNAAPVDVPGLGSRPPGSVLTVQLLAPPTPGSGVDPTLAVPATISSSSGITDVSGLAWNIPGSPDTEVER